MKLVVMVGIVIAVAFGAGNASADEAGKTTIKTVTIVGNARRPVVTVVVARQKIDVPLHPMTHPLDQTPAATASGF